MSKSILSTIVSALALVALTGEFPKDDKIGARSGDCATSRDVAQFTR